MHSRHQLRTSPEESRWWLWGGTSAACLCFAAGNMALFPLFLEETTATTVYVVAWGGVVLAQIGLVAIWLALGRPSALVRVAVSAGALLVLVTPYLAGFLWRACYEDLSGMQAGLNEQLAAVLRLPALIVTAAAPLWLARLLFGWHIRHELAPAAVLSHQYSIGGLLVFTTVVASLLAACQQALHIEQEGSLESWLIMGGWCLVALVLSSLTLFPAAISLSRPLIGLGILIGIAAAIYATLVLIILRILLFYGLDSEEVLGTLGFVGCPIFAFVITIAALLAFVRACGYRLVMGGRGERAKGG